MGYWATTLALTTVLWAVVIGAGNALGLDTAEGDLALAAQGLTLVGAVLMLSTFMIRSGRWTMRVAGWPSWDKGIGWFGKGAGLGLALAALALLAGVMGAGGAITTDGGTLREFARRAAVVLAILLPAALAEEMLFRGYPLSRLATAFGRGPAVATLALPFALLHAGNPEVTLLGLTNIAIVAVLLSLAYFTPGALAAAWGLHFGWNATLMLSDAPVSGVDFRIPMLEYLPAQPDWWSGGTFGPEGGLVATVVGVVGVAVLVRVGRGR